jgi:hypothetical protein
MRNLIDLDRFPIDQPGSGTYAVLLERAKADLAATGMFNLDGFLKPDAALTAVAELGPRFDKDAFTHARKHNIYFRKDLDLPADHPALREVETINRTLCADQISADNPIIRIYEWSPFAAFLAAAMDIDRLHVMADPLARVNVMDYRAGQGLNWHFDRSEFTTTLLLQAPDAGGVFEYRSDLRSANDPNYDGVARLLRDEDPARQSLTLKPGTLNVFRGKNTAHRVTPVQGAKNRMIAVFSYYDRPGVLFSEDERRGFYGRAA